MTSDTTLSDGSQHCSPFRSNGDNTLSRASPKPPSTRPTSTRRTRSRARDRPRPPAGHSNAPCPFAAYPRRLVETASRRSWVEIGTRSDRRPDRSRQHGERSPTSHAGPCRGLRDIVRVDTGTVGEERGRHPSSSRSQMPPGTDNAITATTEQRIVNRTSLLGRRVGASSRMMRSPSARPVWHPPPVHENDLDHSFLTKLPTRRM